MNQNVQVVPAVGARDGYACKFQGDSRLLFWRFANTWFGNDVCIKVRFQPDRNSNPSRPEMLVANNDCTIKPTMKVAYDRSRALAMGEVQTRSDPMMVTTNGNVSVTFDGPKNCNKDYYGLQFLRQKVSDFLRQLVYSGV